MCAHHRVYSRKHAFCVCLTCLFWTTSTRHLFFFHTVSRVVDHRTIFSRVLKITGAAAVLPRLVRGVPSDSNFAPNQPLQRCFEIISYEGGGNTYEFIKVYVYINKYSCICIYTHVCWIFGQTNKKRQRLKLLFIFKALNLSIHINHLSRCTNLVGRT